MKLALSQWADQKNHSNFHRDVGWSSHVRKWESCFEENSFQWNKKCEEKYIKNVSGLNSGNP